MSNMTDLERARGRVAELLGWWNRRGQWETVGDVKLLPDYHPVPLELGAILGLLPKGWGWSRVEGTWCAFSGTGDEEHVLDTGDHILDALNLVLAVLEQGGKDGR
jgi:hypothetical protein